MLAELTQHLRRHEPDQRPRSFLVETLQIDSADAALAKLQRALGTDADAPRAPQDQARDRRARSVDVLRRAPTAPSPHQGSVPARALEGA